MAEQDIDALLAAYVDGVSELTPDERKRVEARLAEQGDAGTREIASTREVLDQLRALPAEGNEPDWRALEKRIASAVDEVRTPWWKRWFVPVGALAVTAAAAMLWIHHTPDPEPVQPPAHVALAPARVDAAVPAPPAQSTDVWLDGQLVDVSDVDIGEVDKSALFDEVDAPDAMTAEDDGLLPAGELGWVDQLDDRAIDRAEHWLERKKS